jgi:iron(III) transport system permease protein
MGSLVWRAGMQGAPHVWSAATTWHSLLMRARTDGDSLVRSLNLAAGSGAVCAALALVACWAAIGARWFRNAVLILMALAWATPGPVVGLGLKDTILGLLKLLDTLHAPRVLDVALWDGPSPLPLLWVNTIRFFPYAVAVLWPVVRLTPPELRDAARVDGASPAAEFLFVTVPLYAAAALGAAAGVAVLSLGEISAGKLVSTPGWDSFAEVVWAQMHYGVTNEVAAYCLLLSGAAGLGGALAAALGRFLKRP